MLTLAGSVFPSRVGASLYSSLQDGGSSGSASAAKENVRALKALTVLGSLKEAEDQGLRLMRLNQGARMWSNRAPVAQQLSEILLSVSTCDSSISSIRDTSTRAGKAPPPPSASANRVGFFDSARAVRKLVFGLEALFESEACAHRRPASLPLGTGPITPLEHRAQHSHVLLCDNL